MPVTTGREWNTLPSGSSGQFLNNGFHLFSDAHVSLPPSLHSSGIIAALIVLGFHLCILPTIHTPIDQIPGLGVQLQLECVVLAHPKSESSSALPRAVMLTHICEWVPVNSSHWWLRLVSQTGLHAMPASFKSSPLSIPFHPHCFFSSSFSPSSPIMSTYHSTQVQSPLPSVILGHFIRQVQEHHYRTLVRSPLPLHYDTNTRSLSQYPWYYLLSSSPASHPTYLHNLLQLRPCDEATGERVPPSMLEAFRRTHDLKGPCCLCPFLDRSNNYAEAFIGIVEVARHELEFSHSEPYGEYVAVCSRWRCGYFREYFLIWVNLMLNNI